MITVLGAIHDFCLQSDFAISDKSIMMPQIRLNTDMPIIQIAMSDLGLPIPKRKYAAIKEKTQ
jgi:hypothetical protein